MELELRAFLEAPHLGVMEAETRGFAALGFRRFSTCGRAESSYFFLTSPVSRTVSFFFFFFFLLFFFKYINVSELALPNSAKACMRVLRTGYHRRICSPHEGLAH